MEITWTTWIKNHQWIVTSIIALIGPIGSSFILLYQTRINRKAQIQINKELEKSKFEMQRQYLHIEIKTRNLLEIYPKLHAVIQGSGKVIIFFITIQSKDAEIKNKSISDELKSKELKLQIQEKFNYMFDGTILGLEEIRSFAEYYESSALFISEYVDNIAQQIKNELMQLYSILKNEIANDKYQSYTYSEFTNLINRTKQITDSLQQRKSDLKKQMNKELNPY